MSKKTGTESSRERKRPAPKVDEPQVEQFTPSQEILADFDKSMGRRTKGAVNWVYRVLNGEDYAVAYFTNVQKVKMESVYSINDNKPIMTGKTLLKERYNNGILKFLAEKFNGEKYSIEKMVVYEYNSKFRGADGKKPKPYTYVVVSQKIKGTRDKKFIRMEFDSKGNYTGQLAQPLDERDVQ